MLVLAEGKTGVPGEKALGAEKGTNNKLDPYDSAESGNRTPGHIGGSRVLSPLHHPFSHEFCYYFLFDIRQEVGRCVIDGSVISEEQVGKRIMHGITGIVVKTNQEP